MKTALTVRRGEQKLELIFEFSEHSPFGIGFSSVDISLREVDCEDALFEGFVDQQELQRFCAATGEAARVGNMVDIGNFSA